MFAGSSGFAFWQCGPSVDIGGVEAWRRMVSRLIMKISDSAEHSSHESTMKPDSQDIREELQAESVPPGVGEQDVLDWDDLIPIPPGSWGQAVNSE